MYRKQINFNILIQINIVFYSLLVLVNPLLRTKEKETKKKRKKIVQHLSQTFIVVFSFKYLVLS